MQNPQTSTASAADLANVNSLLEELNLEIAVQGEEVIEEIVEEEILEDEVLDHSTVDEATLLKTVAALERNEAYASQSSEADTEDPTAVPAAPVKAERKQRAASGTTTPRAAAAPRTPRDMNKLSDEHFVLEGDPTTMDATQLAANRATVMASTPQQKKVAEKFENLFTSLAASKKPSTYIVDAFQFLDSKKSITSTDLVAAFKADGYDEGTARSQVGQIMNLFETVKIADRSKSNLTLNPASRLAERLRNIINGATV